jgi:carboxyl-terminal processing protease
MKAWLALLAVTSLAACGDNVVEFPPSASYANHCAHPRSGVDPVTGDAYPDVAGSRAEEDGWVRSWIDEYYLWYSEVPRLGGADFPTTVDYFEALKTYQTTPSGKPKDQFHFTYDTATWESLATSDSEAGYGARFAVLVATPPRIVVVAYVEPGSPAVGVLARGDRIVTVDGADVTGSNDVATLNGGLFPANVGETHTFEVLDVGASATRTVMLTSASITGQPVQHVGTVAGGAVGYMLFNDHLITAEAELVAAMGQLQAAGVTDLVLDLRYNGGGYLAIASELAYMIAGPARTANRVFELEQFNDKYPSFDPIANQPLEPTPFLDKTVFASPQAALPHLDLPRVFVLTGGTTCSASEAIINGLTGVGVSVIQIGTTTCGKPYGFYPQDNCGTTYFSIQFRGVNDMGFGDYSDGFSTDGTTAATLPGCAVADDFTHELGDPAEARLAAALMYRANATCPPAMRGGADGRVIKPPWLQNRLATPR